MVRYQRKFMTMVVLCILFCGLTACGTRDSQEISINGMEMGEKVSSKLTDREHLVMDAEFTYMHKDVGFDVDGENHITYLSYFATFNLDGDNLGFEDAKIVYKGNSFESLEDMVTYFEENNQSENKAEDEGILYYEDDTCEVKVRYREEDFIGIVIKKK